MSYTKNQRTAVRSILLGIATILLAVFISKQVQKAGERPQVKLSFSAPVVEVFEVRNKTMPLSIKVDGRLKALNRIEIFSEVGGILTNKNFREGNRFNKGNVLVKIDDTEFRAQLKAQRSAFIGTLNSTLPDLALDFENDYQAWKNFGQSVGLNSPIPALPKISDRKLEQFLSGRGILNAYYNIRSQEARLSKFYLRAPFEGVLSQASIQPGTQVRAGQLLGLYIQEGVYELQAPVAPDYLEMIAQKEEVELTNPENDTKMKGRISRVNSSLDPLTQMINVFIEVKSNELRDGMYARAELGAGEVENCILVDERLLTERNTIFICNKDSLLEERKPAIAYRGKKRLYVQGLVEGEWVLANPLKGAHVGLKVSPSIKN